MTIEERRVAFRNMGCVPRSLSFLSSCPISEDEFITKYDHCFLPPPDYGQLNGSGFDEVLAALNLNPIGYTGAYSDTNAAFHGGLKILVRSEIDLLPPEITDVISRHASALTSIGTDTFSLWSPQKNGGAVPITLSAQGWITKKCLALFYQ